jgi:molybdopterin-guanine dinucleotide biosynthesis protein A
VSDQSVAGEPRSAVVGVVLAGGKSSRMGGIDKGGLMLAGRSMVAHVIDRFRPQVARLVLNAPLDRYVDVALPHAPDPVAGQPGPLTGLLAGMHWAQAHAPQAEFVATVPVDTPFLPDDVVARLLAAFTLPEHFQEKWTSVFRPEMRQNKEIETIDIAYAVSPTGPQPVFVVARIALAETLERDLVAGEASRVGDWIRQQRYAAVRFPHDDAFANINSPDDLAAAEARIIATGEDADASGR